jgi:hypothetical protein
MFRPKRVEATGDMQKSYIQRSFTFLVHFTKYCQGAQMKGLRGAGGTCRAQGMAEPYVQDVGRKT